MQRISSDPISLFVTKLSLHNWNQDGGTLVYPKRLFAVKNHQKEKRADCQYSTNCSVFLNKYGNLLFQRQGIELALARALFQVSQGPETGPIPNCNFFKIMQNSQILLLTPVILIPKCPVSFSIFAKNGPFPKHVDKALLAESCCGKSHFVNRLYTKVTKWT